MSVGEDPWAISYEIASPVNASSRTEKLYFNANGSLLRDTTMLIGKKLYTFADDGTSVLTAGWLDAGRTRYMLKNGKLATGRQQIDGQYYFFNSQGEKQVNVLRKSSGKWYFYGDTGAQVTRPMGYNIGGCYVGGLSTDSLKAVWNSDGSLAKVVYAGTGQPAAGETVSFGWWDNSTPVTGKRSLRNNDNGYLLDSKGLPVTGLVTGFRLFGRSYSMILSDDGSRVFAAGEAASLIPVGKKIYVLEEGLVCTGAVTCIAVDDWSRLSAADQTLMHCFENLALLPLSGQDGIAVCVQEDGSVYGDAVIGAGEIGNVFGEAPPDDIQLHTNRLGVLIEPYSPVYKIGKTWYTMFKNGDTEEDVQHITGSEYKNISVLFKVKSNGELLGICDAETGKPLNGFCMIESAGAYIFFLKNGMPLTGKQSAMGYTFYTDAQLGVFPMPDDLMFMAAFSY